ncbi:serine/threonine protein kinase [Streptococcus iniae]|uniref:protein kinase domain-containing protein n=1 Tax=Streptococcus iniae TaxID=1346 RepID=UPI0008DA0B1C|nr:protein kinase [Streptococcus iniae]OHX26815.1 protein kinase [Streptococcus iniae]RLV27939.1 serine/threonine protein kinase [Streptococcus iniae]
MINPDFYKRLATIFCGDEMELFTYKSGPQLVSFFNTHFNTQDSYGQSFPTRWIYVNDKLLDFSSRGIINSFFNLILSKQYLLSERQISEVDALEHQQKILMELDKICSVYSLKLSRKGSEFYLVEIDLDLVEIGKGGFADIYFQKSTGLVLKKLNEESVRRKSLRSRFKSEYEITKSCSDIGSIIKVFDFDSSNCSYTMEKADYTLVDYIGESELTEDSQINIIRQILYTMSIVHQRDVLHRDLSPTNVFFVNGIIKIADFGLGKNLKTLTSHQTMDTSSFGQLLYCAPEQRTLLKDADKRSDVFSLGRIINFVMSKNPIISSHSLRSISEKATNIEPNYRYQDASEMLNALNSWLIIRSDESFKKNIWEKIDQGVFDNDIENYIYEMSAKELCRTCIKKRNVFIDCLIAFMKIDDSHANYIIQMIHSNYAQYSKRFEDADPFATLSYRVLSGNFSFTVNEIAARILKDVAYTVGRFSAQRMIDNLIDEGLEPLIESILER